MKNLEYLRTLGAEELAGLIYSNKGYFCGLCKRDDKTCDGKCWQGIIDWLSSEREEELKPCPFCGGKALVHETEGGWSFVFCNNCLAEVHGDTKAEAIEAWNRRVE